MTNPLALSKTPIAGSVKFYRGVGLTGLVRKVTGSSGDADHYQVSGVDITTGTVVATGEYGLADYESLS